MQGCPGWGSIPGTAEHRFVPCPGHCAAQSHPSHQPGKAGARALQRQWGQVGPFSTFSFGEPGRLQCLGFLPVARNSFCTCQVTKENHFCLRWFTLLWVQFQSGIFRAYHMPFINVSVPAQKLGGKRNAASLLCLTRTQALHNLQTAKGTALSLASKGCILTLLQSPSWCKKSKSQPFSWIFNHFEAFLFAINQTDPWTVAVRTDISS